MVEECDRFEVESTQRMYAEAAEEQEATPSLYMRALESLAPKQNPNPKHSPEALERLFTKNYQHVKDEASVAGLSIFDIDELINRIAVETSWFDGPADDTYFCQWVTERLKRETSRLIAFNEMRDDPTNQRYVRGVIGSIVWRCKDLGVDLGNPKKGIESPTVTQLAREVWTLIHAEFDDWLEPGKPYDPLNKPPKFTTRLSGLALKYVRIWREEEIRVRERLFLRPKREPKPKKAKLTGLEQRILKAEKAADASRDGDHDSPLEDDLFIEIKKKKKKRDNFAFIA